MNAIWLLPLVVGALGAAGATALAARLRRQVELLQRSMRPLRVEDRPRRRY